MGIIQMSLSGGSTQGVIPSLTIHRLPLDNIHSPGICWCHIGNIHYHMLEGFLLREGSFGVGLRAEDLRAEDPKPYVSPITL